ncbi:cold-shock' DNA-binding domain-containing protein [Chytriomyces sp. MP71]|nr:cold-shock' DNA-binding domain-containing protein [Chytriomyces sp. MP71]
MKDNSTLDTTISDDSQRISEPESATGGSIRPQSPVAPLQAGFSLVGRTTGYVKFFNSQKGYGFIIPAEGELEVFVHHTAILRSDGGFRSLAEGEEVEFDMIKGPKGLQAANVTGPNDPGSLQYSSPPQYFGGNGLPQLQVWRAQGMTNLLFLHKLHHQNQMNAKTHRQQH